MKAKLYLTDSSDPIKEVDLSEYPDGGLPTVIIYRKKCYVYSCIVERGQVAEYTSALTLTLPS